MCYRYTLKKFEAVTAFAPELAAGAPANWTPRYNTALTNPMPVIVQQADRPALHLLPFGYQAPARQPGERPLLLANARIESLLAKPFFREAADTRRCLIPADGFYEWEKQGTTRLPHYFQLHDGQPFYFAGLWQTDESANPAGFAIVTTQANDLLRPIHERMPVLLGPNSSKAWLGAAPLAPERLTQFSRPLPAERMTGHRVHIRMNHVRYQAADCSAPLADSP